MKRILLMTLCLMAAWTMQAQKIDFDYQGKSGSENFTELGFLNWPIGSKGVASDTIPHFKADGTTVDYPSPALGALPEGMQIICTNANYKDGGETMTVINPGAVTETIEITGYQGVVSVWAKNNVQSNKLSKVPGDAVSSVVYDDEHNRYNPADWSPLRLVIKGMKAGSHTLMAYHNCSDYGNVKNYGPAPAVKVLLNGAETGVSVVQTNYDNTANYQSIDDIASTFISFTAVDGQDVVIDYVPFAADGMETNHHMAYLNGIVFDAVDPNMKVTAMRPVNGNLHVDAIDGTAILSWTGSASAASHRVMFGTSEDNLQEVQNTTAETYTATGLSCLNTYYWRVDEVPAAGEPVVGEVCSFRINRLAFPGAEGFGRYAIGGRDGQVVHVTSLEDDGTEGTLRYALATITGPRTVVFDVSGVINLTSNLVINEPYVTIAGQTAPGNGIVIRGRHLGLTTEGVTRYIRHRMGKVFNEEKGEGYDGIALQGKNNSILDHSTISWATGEMLKVSGHNTSNLTVQNCIVAEAIMDDSEFAKGGFGFSAGGESGSFHHNLMANNDRANPSIAGGTDAGGVNWVGENEYFNNVVYNWKSQPARGSSMKFNFANNYYKAGPASGDPAYVLGVDVPKSGKGTIDGYVSGNLLEKGGATSDGAFQINQLKDEETGEVAEDAYMPNVQSDTKVVETGAVYEDAKAAYANVLCQAGASITRDSHDKRLVSEVVAGTVSLSEDGMVANVDDTWYDVYENVTRDAEWDANQDGIADWFATAMGITDAKADAGDGYTNLEKYLNFIAAPYVNKNAGETAEFNLADYFAGISNATYTTDKGIVESTTLKVPVTASDAILTVVKVKAQSGDVAVTREFHICVSGGSASGINNLSTAKAKVESYELYNASGMLVGQGNGNGAAVDRLPLKGEKNGLYILKVKDTEGRSRSFSVIMK